MTSSTIAADNPDAEATTRPPVVRTAQGALRGSFENGIAVFRGIPYAEPPVGKLRFRPPARRIPWAGVRDATHFGDVPPQLMFNADDPQAAADVPRGDDYLNLNVWSPDLGGAGLPVMLWITGGGFWWGAGSLSTYDGATFARDGVVCVTINYRVHADGFLHLGDRPGSGAFGILDQIAALEWVQENIAAFGGNPNRVTVIGQSAGALSIGMLLSAPAARGLFQQAILESGATQGTIGADGALIVAEEFLKRIGAKSRDDEAIEELSSAQLVKAAIDLAPLILSLLAPRGIATDAFGLSLFAGYLPFWPVRGSDVMPLRPIDAVAAGSARDVDILVGTTLEEARGYLVVSGRPEVFTQDGAIKWANAAFAPSGRSGAAVFDAYRRRRPGAKDEDVSAAIMTDLMFRIPAIRFADAQQRHNPHLYMYRFKYRSLVKGLGSAHELDVPFVWDKLDDPLARARNIPDNPPYALAKIVHGARVSFMMNGKPAYSGLPEWPTYDPERRTTMELNVDSHLLGDPDGG